MTIICHDNYFIILSGLSHVIVFRNRSNIWRVVMNIKLYENIVMSASPNANPTICRSHELEEKYINMKRKRNTCR